MTGEMLLHAKAQFLKSALAADTQLHSLEEIRQWLKDRNLATKVSVERCTFDEMQQWRHDHRTGRIRHDSGKYYSIDGIRVQTNWGSINQWDQPIINQPEIGYLGIIAKSFNGVLHFLLQAKAEPGNLNHVQLSPTLQATRSNYTCIHKGRAPHYLHYFQNASSNQILLDQLQSEQGARFLRKRNRNIIIQLDDDIEVHEDFIWLTLGQIKELLRVNNLVNMDTRTVISGITFGNHSSGVIDLVDFLVNERNLSQVKHQLLESALTSSDGRHSIDEIITFLTHRKSQYDLDVSVIPLADMEGWSVTESEIKHQDDCYFKVIAVKAEIEGREVRAWHQPMVEPSQEGICAFVCKMVDGLMHFAVQAKLECGNHDVIEFAPTVQCLTGNYRQTVGGAVPFLEYVLSAKPEQRIVDTMQSEEGGRFFQEQNRNMIILAGDELSEDLPPQFIWMTLNQLLTFLKHNNYLNVQARSLISQIAFK